MSFTDVLERTFIPSVVNEVANALAEHGFIVLDDFLPSLLANDLAIEANYTPQEAFKAASIGRQQLEQTNLKIRQDRIRWFAGESVAQLAYLAMMESLRLELNRCLFLGLFDYECHFAHYSQGAFYKRHHDAFKGSSNRVLSSVVYLNHGWQHEDAGELLMFDDEHPSKKLIINPVFNRCVIFLSERFPHEVLAARRDRFSIAGWYRTNNSSHWRVDPST